MIEIIDDKKREKLSDDNGEPYYCFHLITKENGQTKDNYSFFSGRRAVIENLSSMKIQTRVNDKTLLF